jgi:plastocyanin
MKRSIVVATLFLLGFLSFAFAEKKEGGHSHAVAIKGMKFDPPQVEIAVGDSVVWTNDDERDHTIVANDKSFKSDNIGKDGSFEHKFNKAGKFGYACSYHPRMKGVVVVSGG